MANDDFNEGFWAGVRCVMFFGFVILIGAALAGAAYMDEMEEIGADGYAETAAMPKNQRLTAVVSCCMSDGKISRRERRWIVKEAGAIIMADARSKVSR